MTVTRLAFKLGAGTNQIDLAKSMSAIMRTMIRQKQTFTILGGQIVDNADATVKISTAPNTWYVRAAVNRGFKAWKQMRSRTLENASLEDNSPVVGKYSDYKVTLNGASTTILPHYTGGGTVVPIATPSEWNYADLTAEDGQSKSLKIMGDHTGAYYGLCKGWLETRALPDATNEPTMPDLNSDSTPDYEVDFLNTLHDTQDGQPERLALVYEENDNAPFAIQNVYGNVDHTNNLQLQSLTYTSSTNPHHMVAGFKALCGLIQVDVAGGSDPILFLDVLNTPEAF
tara:strand:+ start:138 stop:992 length:855 start_codon:yes stop_codon:yes gene_type:complete